MRLLFKLIFAIAVTSVVTFAQARPAPNSDIPRTATFGLARPVHMAEMPSLVRSRVTKVHVSEGQEVKAGELLVSLDDRLPRAAVAVAEIASRNTARLTMATVELRLARNKHQRIEQAFRSNASAQLELDSARADVDQAAAAIQRAEEEIAAAKATLELRRAELEQYSIRAPFAGQIIQLHAKTGTTVDQSTTIVSIADLSELEAELFLPLEKYGTLKSGAALELKARAPVDKLLKGRVYSVSPVINSASRTFRTVVRFDNAAGQLPAGFSVVPTYAK